MRLIDADKLKRKAQKVGTEAWKMNLTAKVETTLNQFIDWIDEQPTIQPEPTDIDAKEAVYNLAEKIGIHQLFALTVELRGEPIQPEPKEGHWIDKGWNGDWAWQTDGRGNCWRVIECSECGKSVLVESNYCPHCGADMRGEQDGNA